MAGERVKKGGDGAGTVAAKQVVDPFHATLDRALHGEAVLFAQAFSQRVLCRPSDVAICAEADRDIRDGSVNIHVSANAPTMTTAIAGTIRVKDSVLEQRAAADSEGVAREIMRDVFDALQKQVDRQIESLLTDDAKRARDSQPDEPIPGMFAAMESMAAWEGRQTPDTLRARDARLRRDAQMPDPVATRRAKALDAVAEGRQARSTVGDADAAIAAARAGLFSPEQALEKIRRARNQGSRIPADQLLGMGGASDQIDALGFALGSVAAGAKRAGEAARRFGEAASKLSPVPPGEVHAVIDGRVAGKITGLAPAQESLAMRCANCGGRAILHDGEFGTAGASYRCGSCGIVLDDCKQCRAIHARLTDGSCPRCSGRERRKAKA
jgi:predicted RNA-binding Zn-ribbon protein involved in translation (DUF1610 family)